MFMQEQKLSQDCLKEIKLQLNQRLFDTGVISNDVYRLAMERIVHSSRDKSQFDIFV